MEHRLQGNSSSRLNAGLQSSERHNVKCQVLKGRRVTLPTHKSVQLPSEPPLVDASVQLKELGDGPHGEDALEEILETPQQSESGTRGGPTWRRTVTEQCRKRQINCQNSLIQLILTSRFLLKCAARRIVLSAVLSQICAKDTHLDRSSSN